MQINTIHNIGTKHEIEPLMFSYKIMIKSLCKAIAICWNCLKQTQLEYHVLFSKSTLASKISTHITELHFEKDIE